MTDKKCWNGQKMSENWPGIGKNIIGPKQALNSREKIAKKISFWDWNGQKCQKLIKEKTWPKNKLKNVFLYDRKLANLNIFDNFPIRPNTSWKIFFFHLFCKNWLRTWSIGSRNFPNMSPRQREIFCLALNGLKLGMVVGQNGPSLTKF